MKRFLQATSYVAAALLVLLGPVVNAADNNSSKVDIKSFVTNTSEYNPFECNEGDAGGSNDGNVATNVGDLKGAKNAEKAFIYLVGKGLTAEQAAGVIGNLLWESGVDPMSTQKGGPARGIAQWEGSRLTRLMSYGEGKTNVTTSPKWRDFGVQLDFLWLEFQTSEKRAYEDLKQQKTVDDATKSFLYKFERAGEPKEAERLQLARGAYEEFKGSITSGTSGSDPTVTPEADTTTQCTDESGGSAGGDGIVDSTGYAFPVADQKQHSYGGGGIPCPSLHCHHGETKSAQSASDLMYGTNAQMSGRAVYALTDGTVTVKQYRGVRGCFAINFTSVKGNNKGPYKYWYGHLQNPKVPDGATVKAGQQIAEVARTDLGPVCHGRTPDADPAPHLHIDRGCIEGGIPQGGGRPSCRDDQFIKILNDIYYKLPK